VFSSPLTHPGEKHVQDYITSSWLFVLRTDYNLLKLYQKDRTPFTRLSEG
jgi:hypothetical protein